MEVRPDDDVPGADAEASLDGIDDKDTSGEVVPETTIEEETWAVLESKSESEDRRERLAASVTEAVGELALDAEPPNEAEKLEWGSFEAPESCDATALDVIDECAVDKPVSDGFLVICADCDKVNEGCVEIETEAEPVVLRLAVKDEAAD